MHCATRKPAEGTEIVAMWPLLRSQGGRKVAAPNAKWPPPWGPGTKYEYKEVNTLELNTFVQSSYPSYHRLNLNLCQCQCLNLQPMSSISNLPCPISCLLPLVSCLLSPVACLRSPVSCLLSSLFLLLVFELVAALDTPDRRPKPRCLKLSGSWCVPPHQTTR